MKALNNFVKFWYHFIVGDDWRIAVAVIAGLSLTALLVHVAHLQLWWLLPTFVFVMLTLSLWRATRR